MNKGLRQVVLQLFLIFLFASIVHADFGLLLGSFRNKNNAEKCVTKYIKNPAGKKCGVFLEETQVPGKGRWHRVCLGPFGSRKEAINNKNDLLSKGFRADMFLVKTSSQAQTKPLPPPKPDPESNENKTGYAEKETSQGPPLSKGNLGGFLRQRLKLDHAPQVLDTPSDRKKKAEKDRSRNDATEGALEITVEDATLLALENNWGFRVERLTPSIQRTYEQEERAAFDPVLRADGQWSRERDKPDSVSKEIDVSLGISEFLPTGTDLDLSAGMEQTQKTVVTNPDEKYTTNLNLTVTQALLRGMGLDVNLANLRQARIETRVSEYQLRGLAQSLLAEVENAYWDYTLTREEVNIFETSLELGERLTAETAERIRVGQVAKCEIFSAEAEAATRRQELINARSARDNARLRLLRLLNPPGNDLWNSKVVLLSPPEMPESNLEDKQNHIKVALRMRPDLNQARLAVQRGELEVVKTKNGLLPQLDLFVTLGRTGYAASFEGSLTDIRKGEGGLDVFAGLRFQFPAGMRAPKAQYKRSTLDLEQDEEALSNLKQLVEQDVLSAYIEINRSSEQIVASRATRKFQEEKLQAEIDKYRLGKSTMFRVAQAQRDLVESQISAVRSNIDHIKSLTQFYFVEGSLLVRRGISAPGREPVEPSPEEG